ncbi:MAG: hypothetical protein ACKVS6_14560 [Planctomycetota bacterium]
MNGFYKRLLLYGAGASVVSALAYGAWVHNPGADRDTLIGCAEFELKIGLAAEAKQKIDKVLAEDPDNLHAILVDAHCRTLLKDPSGARDRYLQALQLCKEYPDVETEVRVALSMDSIQNQQYQKAKDYLKSAKTPSEGQTYVKLFYVKGLAAELAGERDDAIINYEKAADTKIWAEESLQFQAAARLAAFDRTEAALVTFESLASRNVEAAYYESAKLKFKKGQVDNGAQDLRRLSANAKKHLAAAILADGGFWGTVEKRGDLPVDVRDWLLKTDVGDQNNNNQR